MPEEIVFTSCGTESNNLAILGVCEAIRDRRRQVVTSAVEHPATARPCERLERTGWKVIRLPVDSEGMVSVEDLRARIDGDTALLTVMHANNETGTIMPIRGLADIAREKGALVHTDAAQSVGKIPVRVDDVGADLLIRAWKTVLKEK
jgi:cysteine desulfurase